MLVVKLHAFSIVQEGVVGKILELLLQEDSNLLFKMDKFELNWHVFIDSYYFFDVKITLSGTELLYKTIISKE